MSLFIWPTVSIVGMLTVFPFVYAIILSFTDYNLVRGSGLGFIGLDNYVSLTKDQLFLIALKNTTLMVLCATLVEVLGGFLLATILYGYAKNLKRHIQTILILPMAMAPVAVALMWKYMFNTTYGVVNYVFSTLGFQNVDWLGSREWSLISVIIVDIWQWTPFVLLILLAGYESIETRAAEMMIIDGASRLQFLRYLVIPNLKTFILVAVLLRVIDAFKLFDIVYVLTEGGPGSSTETLSLYGYKLGFIYFNSGYASAESIILVIIITICTFLLMRVIKKVL